MANEYSFWRLGSRFLSLLFSWFFAALAPHIDNRTRLHFDGARFTAAKAAQPHAGRFSAFIARVRSHRLFYGGMGFVPEWAI